MTDLDTKYNEILGGSGTELADAGVLDEAPAAAEPAAKGGGSGDTAYKEPAYDGSDSDGVDPRDESTQKADTDETQDEQASETDGDVTAESSDDSAGTPDGAEAEEIDPLYVEAGRRAGLLDQDIIDLAENKPAVLEAIARSDAAARSSYNLDVAEVAPQKVPAKGAAEKAQPLDKVNFGAELLDLPDGVGEVVKGVQESLNASIDRINAVTGKMDGFDEKVVGFEKSEEAAMVARLDGYFDSVSQTVPILGNTKELSKENVEARMAAANLAESVQQTMGLSEQDALAMGVDFIRGRMAETQLKAKVVKDLESTKKKFTARPSARKKSQKFASSREKGMAVIDQKFEEYGW